MIEINFAREILAIVRAFLLLGMRTQPIYRIILSRLYYAAHHVGRSMLRNVGLTPEQWRGDIHRRIIDELESRYVHAGTMTPNALRALRRLRIYRLRADYELTAVIQDDDISKALRFFTSYFNECRRILGVT
ncbi:hypothetical protein FJZ31_25970 [Candidatus Poribacteria bacterium]|nr:hypothetical protein [Candidatus Poribacteria bacterium]